MPSSFFQQFPCACVWLAVLNGIEPTFGNYILLSFLSTIGSAGTAPVPAAGLVMVLTAYNSVFGTTGTPDGFEFVVAIDWFLDRLVTVVNVTGDNVVAASIAATVNLEASEELALEADEESQNLEKKGTNHSATMNCALSDSNESEECEEVLYPVNLYERSV